MAATPNDLPKIPSFFQALRCECGQAKGAYCDGTHLGFQAAEHCANEPAPQPQPQPRPQQGVGAERKDANKPS